MAEIPVTVFMTVVLMQIAVMALLDYSYRVSRGWRDEGANLVGPPLGAMIPLIIPIGVILGSLVASGVGEAFLLGRLIVLASLVAGFPLLRDVVQGILPEQMKRRLF